jgi:hypothetical protein
MSRPPMRRAVPADDRARVISVLETSLKHAGACLAILAAAGYAFGYISIWLFAEGLGISPSDLGLDQRAYVLLAAIWTLLLVTYAVAAFGLIFSDPDSTAFVVLLALQALTWFALAWAWPSPIGVLLLVVVILSGGATAAWIVSRPFSGRPVAFTGLVQVAAVGALLIGVGYTSWTWGSTLTEQRPTDGGPIALTLVVPAVSGLAQIDGTERCVVRIGERVFITESAVVVEPEPVTFRAEDCE